MTDSEKQAMIQFFGSIHNQAKQTDQMIVGNSQFVKPISGSIKEQLARVLATPGHEQHFQHVQEHVPQQMDPNWVQPMQPTWSPPVEQPQPHSPQAIQLELPLNSSSSVNDIVNVLREINLNLKKINLLLEKEYNGTKNTKNKQ